MPKVLLLTCYYEFNSFINENRAIKLLFSGKAETISTWENINLSWANGKCQLPSILKLVKPIKRLDYNAVYNFSRIAVIKRDNSCCQYCGKSLYGKEITIDHVIPKSHGGATSFTNCVVSCFPCNNLKSNKRLEDVGIKLKTNPTIPKRSIHYKPEKNQWHSDWDNYI